ncbi:hypothetical protein SH2C18_47570 [Clostridium sediminicola]|uniref:hypothetical protein n=1 Tax=Clostridium sediminicola TaxID=3114879 RepID=UPI0031F21A8B
MSNYRRKKNTTNKNKYKNNNINNKKNKEQSHDVIFSETDRVENVEQFIGKPYLSDDSIGKKESLSNNDDESIIDSTIDKTATKLKSINIIKEEICKLPLDPCEKEYIDNSILPILTVLDELSRVSVNLSGSVSVLTNSPIVPRKRSKIKDTIDLIYDINEQCEDVYDVVKKRIDALVDCVK